MRVYEISKQFGVSNKEILDVLSKKGFDVHSHMANLTQEAVDFLQNYYTKSQQSLIEKEKNPQEVKVQPTKPMQQSIIPPQIPKKEVEIISEAPKGLIIEPMTLGQVADKIEKPASELILFLLRQGHICAKNQLLSEKIIEQIANQYQIPFSYPEQKSNRGETRVVEMSEFAQERSPVIVIIGHVDHGKTTLLDFIRKTRVAAKEKGGITQHLGAYQVKTAHGELVFLDTPGHAAFSKMRRRGVKVADIAVLIVAADDGVMPQTIEAIKHAQAAKVPIVVAVNKIDKASPAQIETIKQSLSHYNLIPEDWGGQTMFVPISAKLGTGVDHLIEMLSLQAQLMELKADLEKPAEGFVLESKIEKGRGPVATVICHQGILKIGDFFVADEVFGKVNSLVDSSGKKVDHANPSIPVQVAGFSSLPNAGDLFQVVSAQEYKKLKTTGVSRLIAPKPTTSENAINVILKTDTNSTKEALVEAIGRLGDRLESEYAIVHAEVGDISESDITLAANTQSAIYGLHVKLESKAAALAQRLNVPVHLFYIIYQLLDELESKIIKQQGVKLTPTKIGEAVVRRVFDIKNLGVIAGSYVKEGRFSREGKVVIWRGKRQIGEGKIKSLERDRKSVKEVHAGFECAFLVDGFNEWEIDDRVDCIVDLPAK